MPYDIPIGNFERRAIVSTSRLVTAVLKVAQKVFTEFSACFVLVANEEPASSRTRNRGVNFVMMLQSATNTKTKGSFWRCSKDSRLLLSVLRVSSVSQVA